MRNFALYVSCFMALIISACAPEGDSRKQSSSVSDASSSSDGGAKSSEYGVTTAALTVTLTPNPDTDAGSTMVWSTQDCVPTDDPSCNAEGPGQWLKCGSDTKKCTYYESDKDCKYTLLGSDKVCTYSQCYSDGDCLTKAMINYPDYFPNDVNGNPLPALMNPTCVHTEQSVADDEVNGVCFNAFATCTAGNGVCAKKGKSTCANGVCSCSVTADNETNKLPEACNGVDDDCDGLTDEEDAQGCTKYYVDSDVDTYGASGSSAKCLCTKGQAPDTTFTSLTADDCNDNSKPVHLGATEVCDSIDNNCDGNIDEGFTFKDYDNNTKNLGDGCGAGVCKNGKVACAVGGASATCDKLSEKKNESCNGLDDDCNGIVDNGLDPKIDFYKDADSDQYGGGVASIQCGPFNGYVVTIGGDCNDLDSTVHPDATETCNGVDDDCNDQTDEGFTFKDYDNNTKNLGAACGTGACKDGKVACASGGASATCDKLSEKKNESCNDADDNCDGKTDEGVLLPFYLDSDKDSYGDVSMSVMKCLAPANYVTDKTDCNDANEIANPVAPEICDGVDNDCDNSTDEGCDDDNDGYCDSALPYLPSASCQQNDCNDAEKLINPGVADVCDGVDNDCDSNLDQKKVNNQFVSTCNACANVVEVDCDTEYDIVWPTSPAISLIETYQCTAGAALKIKLTAAEVVLAPKPKAGASKFSLQILTAGTGTIAARLHGSCSPNVNTKAVSYYDPALAAANKPTGTCAAIGTTSISGGVIGSDNVVLDAVTSKSVKIKFKCVP